MSLKEAKARIKINKLLEESGWQLVDDKSGKANVVLESNVKITHKIQDEWGEDFENASIWFFDYILLDDIGVTLFVV